VREGERNSKEDIVPNLMGETHKILYLNFFLSHKGEIMLYERTEHGPFCFTVARFE
jgi:hypothetical protein